jgi:two-component system response regulator FixJ
MTEKTNVTLIDHDASRRAAISHCLAGCGVHAEPFEGLDELTTRWPKGGLFLVHDKGDVIIQLLSAMAARGQWMPVIAYEQNPTTRRIVNAVIEGAIDYFAWPTSGTEVASILAEAERKADVIGNAKLREALARSRVARLTRREKEVLEGVARGLSNKLIGETLQISARTVEIHRANMLNKLEANHSSEAIKIAIEASLVA